MIPFLKTEDGKVKITKIGRERPILYRGKFSVPKSVISRLAVSQNHLALAETANFNAKIDQFYLAIDNALSATIMAKEGNLGTTDHRQKIVKFFKHFGRRAKIRSINTKDFDDYYSLWSRSRYSLYFPSSKSTWEMGLFSLHLYEFAVTEISRFFKSDEIITARRVASLLKVYQSSVILEEASDVHEMNQMQLEEEGDEYGGKLERKLLNPWNYIHVSLVSDHDSIIGIADSSKEIRVMLTDFVDSWDKMIKKVISENLERIGIAIANAKMKKKGITEKQALEEAFEECVDHPELLKFRLSLNFTYDSMSAKEEIGKWGKIIAGYRINAASTKNSDFTNKAHKSGWENYKSAG
ncbi:MAG: hypothetical protein ABSA75_02485 [Candidatus Bathyarchaeia archaeon]